MNNLPKRHDNWIVYGKDSEGNTRQLRCLYYSRKEAIKRFRETYNVVGKHNVIDSIGPQFGLHRYTGFNSYVVSFLMWI